MQPLARQDLLSLEQYAAERPAFRARVMEHKKLRSVHVGPNVLLLFEDRLTIQYQIQEMLRAERIFEPHGIAEELDAYNPLIPDGGNWKATLMVQFEDVEERRKALADLIGIEDRVWVQVGDDASIFAISDEDLERSTDEKTSSVHFLRFEFGTAMIAAAKARAPVSLGIDHPRYRYELQPLPGDIAAALVRDFD